ncbi:hypothetical protein HB670_27320 [Bacillus cereus]|uniref:type III toxin-antitoxin system TenpIN family toxin n=1 Tax=Bacillus cereus TaxID=1396 RepID=UPI0014446BFE|nr:hypothetical protein [Bacillus cereus]NKX03300.1 hypothetical protein [Bacillus cereus]
MTHIFEIRQLTEAFYKENVLEEMLDKGVERGLEKKRGYGVLLVEIRGHKFAIPFRSKMDKNHPANYTTRIYKKNNREYRHGLDFTKAVIIGKESYVSQTAYKLHEQSDFDDIRQKEHFIKQSFEKYVNRYAIALEKGDQNILNGRKYKYSTLKNYHNELCPQTTK